MINIIDRNNFPKVKLGIAYQPTNVVFTCMHVGSIEYVRGTHSGATPAVNVLPVEMLLTGRLAKALQLTLALIKPDGVAQPLVLEVGTGFCTRYEMDAIYLALTFRVTLQSFL